MRIFFFFLFSLLLVGAQAQSLSEYDQKFRAAYQLEKQGLHKEAVQKYLEVYALNPKEKLPLAKIRQVIEDKLKRGEDVTAIRKILPIELDDFFKEKGVYEITKEFKLPEIPWTGVISFFAIFFALLVAYLYTKSWLEKRKALREEEEAFLRRQQEYQRKREAQQMSEVEEKKEVIQESAERINKLTKKDAVVTEKTRTEIRQLVDSVAKVQATDGDYEAGMKLPDEVDLDDNEVVEALAATVVSKVSTEETEQGKFSSLRLDASLVFDEEDMEFFEKNF